MRTGGRRSEVFSEEPFSPAPVVSTAVEPIVGLGLRSRRLTADDIARFADHLTRLDADTRRLRFGAPVNDRFLKRYAATALSNGAYLRGVFVEGTLRGVAELHLDGSGRNAEGAFSLETPYQSRGIGTRLFGAVLDAARNRNVEKLTLNCLRENVRMQRIARRQGAEIAINRGDVVAEILRPHPDAGTLAREWSEDLRTVLDGENRPAARVAA